MIAFAAAEDLPAEALFKPDDAGIHENRQCSTMTKGWHTANRVTNQFKNKLSRPKVDAPLGNSKMFCQLAPIHTFSPMTDDDHGSRLSTALHRKDQRFDNLLWRNT